MCLLGRARGRRPRLLRARLAALGSSALPGEAAGPLGARTPRHGPMRSIRPPRKPPLTIPPPLTRQDEASLWYEDHERIAHRPAQWLRRHVSCVLPQVTLALTLTITLALTLAIALALALALTQNVSCAPAQEISAAPTTCKAVTTAMRWYYA